MRDFLRTIHHERVSDILLLREWPRILQGKVERQELINVCKSHGESIEVIMKFDSATGIDLRLCAMLLRLADILDFDTTRAPDAVYYYSGFDKHVDPASRFSKEEWMKHLSSHGFSFERVENRAFPYDLPYNATCPSMKIEQTVNVYIDWVDKELAACQGMIRFCNDKWRNLKLPRKVVRNISANGYLSGQFCLTLDQEKVLELLVGKNLYHDPSVFVRELLQNAIDAVRTREQLDKNLPRNWKPQINIRSWMDEEGYHWFRIEDNGIGMNEDIIKRYFLKVGRSYYASAEFRQEKYRTQADDEYTPISRFGIGILSCFMGDKRTNQVEISTKHYSPNSEALRMSMHGTSGYYYLANKNVCRNPVEMKGVLPEEKKAYRSDAGTAIAVRTNLYQSRIYHSFKEILDHYIVYPVVPIHYEDENVCVDYPTEQEMMQEIHSVETSAINGDGIYELVPTDMEIQKWENEISGLKIEEKPKLFLKCIALDNCTETDFLSGVVLLFNLSSGKNTCTITLGTDVVEARTRIKVNRRKSKLMLAMELEFPNAFEEKMSAIESCQFYESVIISEEEKTLYQKYCKLRDGNEILLCDLESFEWYKNFFGNYTKETPISIAAHNGILCGNADFFLSSHFLNEMQDVILLLKDSYRPEVDVARVGIKQLPLEVALELEILRKEWEDQGFQTFDFGNEEMLFDNWMTPQKEYLKLLEERPDLMKRLYINTTQGKIFLEEVRGTLLEVGELEVLNVPYISNDSFFFRKQNLYEYFCMAYLKQNYTLKGMFLYGESKVVVLPKDSSRITKGTEEFPPSFFLPIENKEPYFTHEDAYGDRYFCNENHPLSQFLIKNRQHLEKLAPGLYRELLHSIAEDSMKIMMERVNTCLRHLQSLPHPELRVPQEAFLKETDFCGVHIA